MNPTTELWNAYVAMFDHFNAELWEGKLPVPVLNFSRKRGAYGFFWAERWQPAPREGVQSVGGRTQGPLTLPPPTPERAHEISLNPDHSNRSPRDVASTLVHEMAHHWQACFGKPGKGAYHNKEWGGEMKRVGLQPVSFDQPGKETGCRVSHTVVEGGPFLEAFERLPVRAMPWRVGPALADSSPLPPSGRKGKRNKVKYTCPCGCNVWGKPGLRVACEECEGDYVEAA